MYDMPAEIQVEADGPLRIITLNRPAELNAVNDALHMGLARIWNRLSLDRTARVAVITGAGKAFSAGGTSTTSRRSAKTSTCAPRPSPTAARSCWAWRAVAFR